MLTLLREIGRPHLEAVELSDKLPAVSVIPPPDIDRALGAP